VFRLNRKKEEEPKQRNRNQNKPKIMKNRRTYELYTKQNSQK
jgi:hypothetical protein